jgi:hypothetical protein
MLKLKLFKFIIAFSSLIISSLIIPSAFAEGFDDIINTLESITLVDKAITQDQVKKATVQFQQDSFLLAH